MVLPQLTPEQRAEALEKAAQARKVRAEIKAQLKSGELSLDKVFSDAENNEALGKLKVIALLEALPGVGKVKAKQTMDEIGIAESRRIRGLGPHQRSALLERFS